VADYKTQVKTTDKHAIKIKRAYLDRIKKSVSATNWDWVAKNVPYGYQAVYNAIQWSPWNPTPYLKATYQDMEAKLVVKKEAGTLDYSSFQMPNPEAERWLLQYSASEVTAITLKDKEMIQSILGEGQRLLRTNQETARVLRSVIGLTEGQAKAVTNYERALRESGKKDAQVEKLRQTYYNKLLRYRAETIALTESHTATSQAAVDYYREAQRRGALEGYHLVWNSTPDRRQCEVCAAKHGDTGSIESGKAGGERPPLHPRCRCVLITEKDK
jgi:SPP1 gp7 family putative phage head morphogenesis protein